MKSNASRQKLSKIIAHLFIFIISSGLTYHLINFGIPVTRGGLTLEFTFKDMPLIMLAGCFGYMYGFASVFVVFLIKAIYDTRYLYMMFIFTASVFAIGYMATHRWFASRRYTIIGGLITAFNFGPLWWFLVCRISDVSISRPQFENYMVYFLGALPEALISFYIMNQFYKYLPDKVMLFSPIGRYYSDPDYEKLQRSRLSSNITFMIAADCIFLALSAAMFSDFLLPTLPDDVIQMHADTARTYGMRDVFSAHNNPDVIMGKDILVNENAHACFDITKLTYPMTYGTFVFNRHGIAYNFRLIMLIFNAVIPIGVFSNWLIQKDIAAPIVTLSRAANAFVKASSSEEMDANLSRIHAINIKSASEIGDLFHSVEKAADFVVAYVASIRKEHQLQEDLRVATHANAAKNAFLSNMSHELRTPINVILGMDEMILREYDNDENLRFYAASIQNSGRTLLSLVNDILDFSKIEAGKMEIIPVEYDISSVVGDLFNMIQIKAQEKHLTFDLDVNPNIPHLLYGDDIRIKQCILNLLTNAVKYTQEGSIKLAIDYEEIDPQQIMLKVAVSDTGIGLKEEEMDRLYTPFERMDETRNRTIEGTGLGVSIVTNLLSMMDSKLEVSSEYGKGSCFSFAINQRVMSREPVGDISDAFRQSMNAGPRHHDAFHAPGVSILIVDDTVMNLTVITSLLKNTMMSIDTVTSGADTLEAVKSKRYDLIFIDHRMPQMDGIETLEHLKAMGSENLSINAPCIALTANAITGAREEYLAAGFNDYLSKPVDTDKLDKMLIDYLPRDLVHLYGTPEYAADIASMPRNDNRSASDNSSSSSLSEGQDLEALGRTTGLDLNLALRNCGSPDTLKAVIKDFWASMTDKGKLIEEYAANKDYTNYTIQVHSLKSSARLIGATKLSKDAEYLEKCGDEQNEAEIQSRTPLLLALFYSYREKLSAVFLEDEQDKRDVPEISPEEMTEYMEGIRELVEAFDFDSADAAYQELTYNYQIPQDQSDKIEKMGNYLRSANRDAILELLHI